MCLKGNVNSPFPMLLIFECYVDGGFEKNSKYAYISTGAKADKAG